MHNHNQTEHNLDSWISVHNISRLTEKFRKYVTLDDVSIQDLMAGGQANRVNNDQATAINVMVTPGYSDTRLIFCRCRRPQTTVVGCNLISYLMEFKEMM